MNTRSAFFFLLLIAIHAVMPTIGTAQDTDGDGVPDTIESQLLSVLAPVWVQPEPGFNPPLPLDWAVRHCRLVWYDRQSGAFVADTGNTPMTPAVALDTIQAHRNGGLNFNYRLSFKAANYRYGNDSTDPVSWGSLQSQGKGVYGRVTGVGPNRYVPRQPLKVPS